MSQITVIKAGLRELDIVTILFDEYRQFYKQPKDVTACRKFLKERLQNEDSVILLALSEINGEQSPAGFTQLYPSFTSIGLNRTWILNDLFVNESSRRMGVASSLLHAAKEYAVSLGAVRISLETQKINSNAQKLYEKHSYMKDQDHFYYSLYL
ncbi:GNAT family N-acetyltransferase [Metabacillus sp. RGM 3146]|uniref:GNAT family N-acetyltransferase n=1 Tax=Metabacillus sp. RGM 3146 TaxID=3401092 RepID=UPI003B9C5EAD